MSRRTDQLNEHIKRTFSKIIQKEAELPRDVMVTVTDVETAPSLQSATVWISVLPHKRSQEIIRGLKRQMYELQGLFNKQLKLKTLPYLNIKVDHGQQHAENIERQLGGPA